MPTYLIHGFRWYRQSIRIHIILNDLEDATPEWLLAPATSISILNSLYIAYDFLPPSNPPPLAYANLPIPCFPGDESEDETSEQLERPRTGDRPRAPKLKKSKSMISLRSRSLSRKSKRPPELIPPVPPLPPMNRYGLNGDGSGYSDRKGSTSGSDPRPSTQSGSLHRQSLASKPEKKPSFNDWSAVKLLEQYDPTDMRIVSQPYAYVADYMIEVSLGVSITEEMAKYETKMKAEDWPLTPGTPGAPGMGRRDLRRKGRRIGWFEKLRDQLQKEEEIGWHVVVCGDEEREKPSAESVWGGVEKRDVESLRTPRGVGFKGFFKKRSMEE
jgi:hypothetical protein